jgi:Rps23 Pro-64 3,4-dihydroxylase Tpa1-like proline 4-hydroxylase
MSHVRPDADLLLLSNRLKDISYDPFCHFQIENYLPATMYQSLLESFPGQKWFTDKVEGDKNRLHSLYSSEVVRRFCRQYTAWQDFMDFLSSQLFLNDLYEFIRRGLIESRGFLNSRRWCDAMTDNLLRQIIEQPVKMQFEFSRLQRGSFVPPHTDAPDKLVSLLLYFPDPEWRENYGGNTDFFRPKRSDLESNWHNRRVPFDEVVPFFSSPFTPNRLVGFLKSRNSYHGVQPITCPDGMARNSLNINVLCATSPMRDYVNNIVLRTRTQLKRMVLRETPTAGL